MEAREFYRLEEECELRFRRLGPCFHLCTGENCPILFHNENEFKAAMNIVAFLSLLFPDITVITFEIMSNHFHFVVTGEEESFMRWFNAIVKKLKTHPALSESRYLLASLEVKLISVNDLENMRNVIAYINRNGFVANVNETPFSYPWGANRYFFNEEAKRRYRSCRTKVTFTERREMFHSNKADYLKDIYSLDDYICPACFCSVQTGESLFRNARHYFSKITKGIESYSEIAKSIGETLFYNDDELYSLVVSVCQKSYGIKSPRMISAEAKIELAKKLHYDYNSGNKQISRMLGMNINAVDSLFPPPVTTCHKSLQ